MSKTKLYGIEAPAKPFPRVVHELRHEFRDVRSVLDVGAGAGRFLQYFVHGVYKSAKGTWINEAKPPIERYVAVEPYEKSCERLRRLSNGVVEVVCKPWEEVRGAYLRGAYDMVIFWDVAMFVDLRDVYGVEDPAEAIIHELDRMVSATKRWFLFSLHDVQHCVVCRLDFLHILAYLDSRLRIRAKNRWNRVYARE